MPPKTDPYNTPIHRRIDAVLVAIVLAIIAVLVSTSAHAGTAKDFQTGTDLTLTSGYSPTGLPTSSIDLRLTTTAGASLTLDNLKTYTAESISVTNGRTYTILDSANGAGKESTITLGNASGFTDLFSGVASDLIYMSGNSNLTIQGPGGSGNAGLNVVLAGTGNLDVSSGSTLTISAPISGSGKTITTNGAGTIILSGANTYGTSGLPGTTVTAGKLLVNNTSGSGTGAGNVLVNGTGTLGGTGIISGAITVATGATLNPGAIGASGAVASTVGTLSTGALTLQTGSFSTLDVLGVSSYDKLVSSGQISFGGTLNVNVAAGLNFTSGQRLNLFAGTLVAPGSVFSGIADNQIVTFNGYNFYADYTTTGFDLVAVPEPGTWAAAALSFLLVGFTQCRRLQVRFRQTKS